MDGCCFSTIIKMTAESFKHYKGYSQMKQKRLDLLVLQLKIQNLSELFIIRDFST